MSRANCGAGKGNLDSRDSSGRFICCQDCSNAESAVAASQWKVVAGVPRRNSTGVRCTTIAETQCVQTALLSVETNWNHDSLAAFRRQSSERNPLITWLPV